jgi:CopG family nickel-responsive transcriptional regulator
MAQVRFGVSLDEDVLKELDQFVLDNHLPNRSQAIRHLVENRIVDKKWKENDVVSGAIVLLFDHKGDIGKNE